MSGGDASAAVQHFERLCQQSPTDARAHLWLAASYEACHRVEDGLRTLRHATRLQPNEAHVFYSLAAALQRAGQPGEAEQALEKAIAIRPDYTRAKDALARLRGAAPEKPAPIITPPASPPTRAESQNGAPPLDASARARSAPWPQGAPTPAAAAAEPAAEALVPDLQQAQDAASDRLRRLSAATAPSPFGMPPPRPAPAPEPPRHGPEPGGAFQPAMREAPEPPDAARLRPEPESQPAAAPAISPIAAELPAEPAASISPPPIAETPAAASAAVAAPPPAAPSPAPAISSSRAAWIAEPATEEEEEAAPQVDFTPVPAGQRSPVLTIALLTLAITGILGFFIWNLAARRSRTASAASRPPDSQARSGQPRRAAPPSADHAGAAKEASAAAALVTEVKARLDRAGQSGAPLSAKEAAALRERCEAVLRHSDRALELDPGNRDSLEQRDQASRYLGMIDALVLVSNGQSRRAAPPATGDAGAKAAEARGLVDGVSDRIVQWERRPGRQPLSRDEAAALAHQCREALRLCDEALAQDPGNRVAWVQRVRAYRLLEEYSNAQTAVRQALSRFPQDDELLKLRETVQHESRRAGG